MQSSKFSNVDKVALFEGQINNGNISTTLDLIQDSVAKSISENDDFDFNCSEFGQLCLKIGEVANASILTKPITDLNASESTLIISSGLDIFSTFFAETILAGIDKEINNSQIHFVTTNLFGNDLDYFKSFPYKVSIAPNQTSRERLIWLIGIIGKIKPKKIVFLTYPMDAAAVASIQPYLNLCEFYYVSNPAGLKSLSYSIPSIQELKSIGSGVTDWNKVISRYYKKQISESSQYKDIAVWRQAEGNLEKLRKQYIQVKASLRDAEQEVLRRKLSNKNVNPLFQIGSQVKTRFLYLRDRFKKLYSMYGHPFARENYSNYICLKALSFARTGRLSQMIDYLLLERSDLSEFYILQEKFSLRITRILSNNVFEKCIETNAEKIDLLIFDHFGGGGSNFYSKQLIENEMRSGNSLLRVGISGGKWILALYAPNSPEIVRVSNLEKYDDIRYLLSSFKGGRITINSLYGVPNLPEIISFIGEYKALNPTAHLDYLLHDYYPVCPSLHLLSSKGDYCGVPQNEVECNRCYKALNLRAWSHEWIDVNTLPKNIEAWRKQFTELFSYVDHILYFNESARLIMSRALPNFLNKLSYYSVNLPIHNSLRKVSWDNFELHVGILGDLNVIKGSNQVIRLADYLSAIRDGTPITVLGRSSDLPQRIRRQGGYKIEELPDLIEELKINVIFFASIVPETFSYVLTEIFKMGLPVVAYNIGAQGARVAEYPNGVVIPLNASPSQIFEALNHFTNR